MLEACEDLISTCTALKMEVEALNCDYQRVPDPFSEHFFEDGNEKASNDRVKYYTGLPNYKTLVAVYKFASSGEVLGNRTSLTLFQQLFRLNLGDQDLAYRFNVSQSTNSQVDRYFVCAFGTSCEVAR